jgi:hypothetical protein
MNAVVYITHQLRRPSRDGSFAGSIAEGWFREDGDAVVMCDRDGAPLAGEKNRKKLQPGQTHREAAALLLKNKASHFGSRQSFNRPLRYQPMRF